MTTDGDNIPRTIVTTDGDNIPRTIVITDGDNIPRTIVTTNRLLAAHSGLDSASRCRCFLLVA